LSTFTMLGAVEAVANEQTVLKLSPAINETNPDE
jgi:hypothetical protein